MCSDDLVSSNLMDVCGGGGTEAFPVRSSQSAD